MTTLLEDRPNRGPEPRSGAGPRSRRPRRGRRRERELRRIRRRPPRRRGPGGFRTVGILAGLGAIAVAVVLLANAIGGFHISLFGTNRIDRSAPVVLKQLRDVSTFTAATGEFEATVDLEDDVSYVPSFIAGERTIFIGVGTVDAQVDFSPSTRTRS